MTDEPGRSGDRWDEVDRLFDAALERPESERQAFLQAACGEDAELHAAVERLLQALERSEGLLESPRATIAHEALQALDDRIDPPLARVGPYAILRELGRGGMGTVYLGERAGDGFRQRAAVKVLRRGLDTDDILQRFVTERRILGSLSHPNIARLYDGGTTDDGRPFLAMEYVEGEPITRYCDQARSSVKGRLELFLEVADAVGAAHASLIVHRDLKPSNILVSPEGRVKLLDFGIAKLLGPDADTAAHTRVGIRVLTPENASPEQLRGEAVTTATDVYQLGVLLFELLSGLHPHPAPGHDLESPAILAARREPPRPSAAFWDSARRVDIARARSSTPAALRHALKGDLDTIVSRSLSAEVDRRYPSVEQLALDVRRHLEGRTIFARPATATYRTRKFLRRYPWLAPVVGVAFLAGFVWIAMVVRHSTQLERERNIARFEAERADEVRRFLVDLFRSADPHAPALPERGRDIRVVEAIDVGVQRLRTDLTDRPHLRASILSAVSEVYENLGQFGKARPLREEALELQTSLYGASSREVRDGQGHLASLLAALGEVDAARNLFEQRLSMARAASPTDPDEVADALVALGLHLTGRGIPKEAQVHFEEVISLAHTAELSAGPLSDAHRALADIYRAFDRLPESEAAAREALRLKLEAFGDGSFAVGTAHITLAQTLGSAGRIRDAEHHFAQGLPILQRTVGDDHPLTLNSLNNLGVLRQSAGDLAGAEAIHRQVLDIRRRVHGESSRFVGDSYQNLGTILVRQGRLDEGQAMHERARDIFGQVLEPGSYMRALPDLSLSAVHLKQGRHARAEAAATTAVGILRAALPAGHYVTAVAECRVAQALVGRGRPAEAGAYFDRAVPPLRNTRNVPEYRAECLAAAIDFYRARGRSDTAAELRQVLGGD